MQMSSRILGSALHDSVTAILRDDISGRKGKLEIAPVVLQDIVLSDSSNHSLGFQEAIANHEGQRHLLDIVRTKIHSTASKSAIYQLGSDMATSLRTSDGDAQVAALWLLTVLLGAPAAVPDELSTFIVLDDAYDDRLSALQEEIYSFSLSVIEDDDADSRLKALALETIAMQARRTGQGFRDELIDALYPVLHHLGSSVPYLRSHAITCLNIIAEACDYADVKELVVSNADYLINAVALELNAFDVSPQGPQVLLMMVRLAGPSLIPFLEDTIESIFAALDDYHGYPLLVELLFSVLRTIAEEGIKAPQLLITGAAQPLSQFAWCPTSMLDLAEQIRTRRTKQALVLDESDHERSHPQEPWGDVDQQAKGGEIDGDKAVDKQQEGSSPVEEKESDPPPPAPVSYTHLTLPTIYSV